MKQNKEARGNEDFKIGGQVQSRGGCLKKGTCGGAGTPFRTMIIYDAI